MRRSLYLYLFILSVLINVFTYAYFTKMGSFENERLEKQNKRLKDSVNTVSDRINEVNYFSLEQNQNAQNYLEVSATNGRFIPFDKLIPLVSEKLLDLNENPKGNPFTGQEQIGAQKFIINKVKVLNHRWIIADYSDGEYWGEVVLKYFVNENESVDFVLMDSFLYPKSTN